MSFTRVNSGGWAVGASFTSAQANQLDADHASALDKSLAGDTLVGAVGMAATSSIKVSSSGAQIVSQVPGGISASVAGGIYSGFPGGIALTGGANDWPTFGLSGGSPRTCTKVLSLQYVALSSNWTNTVLGVSSQGVIGGGMTTAQFVQIPSVIHKATLSQVAVVFTVGVSHSNVPANLPTIQVTRTTVNTISGTTAPTIVSLSSTAIQSFGASGIPPVPGTGAAWYASGNVQNLIYVCNQNNVIDSSQYSYGISLVDENGANSATGNFYFAVMLAYTNITSMATF